MLYWYSVVIGMVIQIQHLLKLNFVEFLELDIIHAHSNTTLVKVKSNI